MQQQLPEEGGLLGALCPGQRKLEGKCFYLDSVKSRSAALLVEAISLLGGRVESFLHKDVSFVVTGSQEGLKELRCVAAKTGTNWSEEAHGPTKQRESAISSINKQRSGTPRPSWMGCGSRGKALLEKAIRNNERLQGNSVLDNARSWGVKILLVDDVLLYLKQLTRESFSTKHKRPERTNNKHHAARVVKAAALRSPYLKVEDLSRKYKPLHMQSMTFPTLCYSGRFSPFEPPRPEKLTEQGENKTRERNKTASSIQNKPETPLSCNPSPWRPRKKDLAYCECCHQPFTNQDEHLQSDQHRQFVLDSSNYSVVDQLVAEMQPGFNPSPSQQSEKALNSLPTLPAIEDACVSELEPLTDAETEHAIQALLTQGSSFNTLVPSPTMKPLSPAPATPSPGVQPPTLNPATPLADSQPFPPNTDSQPLSPIPAIPLLDAPLLTHCSASQPPDTQHLSPCPDTLCQSSDPYTLPPVLSPQVLDPCHIMQPHSPYSEPPVLSPQVLLQCRSPQYRAEEDMEALSSETETVEIVSQSVPVPGSTPLLTPVGVNPAEGVKGSNQECLLLGFSELMHSSNSLECSRLASRRSRSLPRLSMTAPNPRKRCRSASPEHNPNKRRRTSLTFGYSTRWTGQGHKSFAKPESDIMPMAEACQLPICGTTDCIPNVEQVYVNKSLQQSLSLGDTLVPKSATQVLPTFSACTVEKLGTKQQGLTTFFVPNVQNFTRVPNQTDNVLGFGSTSGTVQPFWPVSPNRRILNPPPHFPGDKSHCTQSSQESHPSLSHSISSVCIESALVPDMGALSTSSSDSDWDCELLSRLGPTPATPLPPTEGICGLDKELLQRPCTWMHNTSYESHLHTVLQPSTPTASLCGEEMDSSAFSRTVVQIVEVQH